MIEKNTINEELSKTIANHFLTIFNESKVSMVITAADGRLYKVNEAYCDLLGYTENELLNLTVMDITHPDDQKSTADTFKKIKKEKINVINIEKRYLRKDGSVVWARVTATWIFDNDENPIYAVTMIEDIGIHKEFEQRKESLERRIRNFHSTILKIATNDFVIKGIFHSAMRFITEEVAKVSGVDRVGIWLFSADRQELRCVDLFEKSKNGHGEGLVLKAKDYPNYFKAVGTGRVVDAGDAVTDDRTKEFAESYLKPNGITSMLDSAIRVSGEIVGIVCHEHIGEPRDWSLEEMNFAAEIADQVAQVLLSSERNKAVEDLRESEERFRMMADSAPVMIWISGMDTLRTFFNKQWLDFVGRDLEKELGKGWIQSVHEDDLEKCLETYLASFKEQKEFETEYRLRRHDNQFRWVLSKGIPRYTHEGEFQGYIGSVIDITDQKLQRVAEQQKAKEALEKSQEYNRMLFELAPIGLALCKMNGELIDINSAYANLIGRTVEETLGLTYWEITPKKYEEDEARQLESLRATGRYGPYEKEYYHKNGHLVPVRLFGMILERNEEKYIWSTVENITETRKHESVLEQKNAALREILEQIEIEKRQIKEDVVSNVESILMPAIRKLKRKGTRLDVKNIKILEKNLEELTSPFGGKVSQKKLKLTPREIEICNMIKSGLSSKEISSILNISFRTVEIHRNNIRKKLSISNKGINLTSYLQTF